MARSFADTPCNSTPTVGVHTLHVYRDSVAHTIDVTSMGERRGEHVHQNTQDPPPLLQATTQVTPR